MSALSHMTRIVPIALCFALQSACTILSGSAQAQAALPGGSREFNYEREFAGERERRFENTQGRMPRDSASELDRRGGWNNDLSWDRRLLDQPDSLGPRGLNPNGRQRPDAP